MHFHALTAFLAFSSASGLVVPSQGSRAASTITWTPAGVESTTAVYPGALATAPDLSVPNADQRVLDVSPPSPFHYSLLRAAPPPGEEEETDTVATAGRRGPQARGPGRREERRAHGTAAEKQPWCLMGRGGRLRARYGRSNRLFSFRLRGLGGDF